MAWSLKSPAFSEGAVIPKKYTCQGSDLSPQLEWEKPPAGTKSIALICDDPDAPMGTWVHWVLWNLPADLTSLPEGIGKSAPLPQGAQQGMTDFRRPGYGGPCPPPGKPHRYYFKLYALDITLVLPYKSSKEDLLKAMHGHILAEAVLMGTYQRS